MPALPITISDGDFSDPVSGVGSTPLAKIAVRFAEAVINATWEQANLKNDSFETKMSAAQAELPDISTTLATINLNANAASGAAVTEPTITIADASATNVYSDFHSQYTELVALLADKASLFLSTHFADDDVFYAQTEDWLQAAIANQNAGIPLAVQSQMLADDQARVLTDAARASDAVLATFAARRFPLPPGAAASAILQIQQKAQDLVAESSRKVAILSVEQMKFAVEKAVNCRQMAMSSSIDYIKALASGPDMASRLVGVGYDAQSKMIGAASQFYGVRAEVAKMANQVSQFNVSSKLEADVKNQAVSVAMIEEKIKTLLEESRSMAQMATSMYNNLHASAGTSMSQ